MTVGPLFALDVETGDARPDSVCALALVRIDGDTLGPTWSTLVRPPRPVAAQNTKVHGLTDRHLADAPTLAAVWLEVVQILDGAAGLVAHHADFDRTAIEASCRAAGLVPPALPWTCTVELARQAWPTLPNHKLPTVAGHLRLELQHHDALSDAKACAGVLLAARRRLASLRGPTNAPPALPPVASPPATAPTVSASSTAAAPTAPAAPALPPAPPRPSPIAQIERQRLARGHRCLWVIEPSKARLTIDGRALVTAQLSRTDGARVYVGEGELVVWEVRARGLALGRFDEALQEALRVAVRLAAQHQIQLAPDDWRALLEARPRLVPHRSAFEVTP